MKLRDLEAQFIKYETAIAEPGHKRKRSDGTWQDGGFEVEQYIPVDTLAEAQGIIFLCPLCFVKNGGSKGTHSVAVSFEGRGVKDHHGSHDDQGNPSRWTIIGGTSIDDLQLAPSIHINKGTSSGCQWHGFVGSNGVPAGEAQ